MSVAQKMFIETIDVTIPHTIEDTNKKEFHQMYNFIYDPFCNRWYAPKYLLSAVQSPVQRTVKLVFCKMVSTSDCLEDGKTDYAYHRCPHQSD